MRAAATDANQREIVEALRGLGCDVVDVHWLGQHVPGFPDLIVGHRGRSWLVEVKTAAGKLTPDECVFWSLHHETLPLRVVRTIEDCVQMIEEVL